MANADKEDKQIGSEEEEEYVLLELDDYVYSDIQPDATYVLSDLDTLRPALRIGDGLKMTGEYEETIGTCYLFSENDAPPKQTCDEMALPQKTKDKQSSSGKGAPSKEVKHLASINKILKFRSISMDHQQPIGYQHKDKYN